METVAANPKGWIFSPAKDAAVFWAPFALLLPAAFLLDAENPQVGLLFYYLLMVPFQDGHLVGTYGTVLRRRAEGRMPWPQIVLGPILVICLFVLVYYHSHTIYFYVLSAVGLAHIVRQQYGWVMVSRRNAQEPPSERTMDSIAIWNQMIPPMIYWLSPLSVAPKLFFGFTPLPVSFAPDLAKAALVFHWLFNIYYILRAVRRHRAGVPVNWGKYSLLASTWVWFYFGLVIQPNMIFFVRGIMTIHSLPYLMFTREKMSAPHPETSPLLTFLRRWAFPAVFVAVMLSFAFGLEAYGNWLQRNGLFQLTETWIGASFQIPLILHYYFDSFIWLRPRNPILFPAYGTGQPA